MKTEQRAMDSTTVRHMDAGDTQHLAKVMARAFFDDPVVGEWFFPDPKRRLRGLRRFFEEEIGHMTLPGGECLTNAAGTGAALWLPPGRWKLQTLALLKLLPSLAMTFRGRLPLLLLGLTMIEKVHPRAPHYYLPFIGVELEQQGRGIGTRLMVPVLERCDLEGVGAYLEASTEANKRLYLRLGFEVTREIVLPSGPPLWPMWREPAANTLGRNPGSEESNG